MKAFYSIIESFVICVAASAQIDSAFESLLQSKLDARRNAIGFPGLEFTIILNGGCAWTTISGTGSTGAPVDAS